MYFRKLPDCKKRKKKRFMRKKKRFMEGKGKKLMRKKERKLVRMKKNGERVRKTAKRSKVDKKDRNGILERKRKKEGRKIINELRLYNLCLLTSYCSLSFFPLLSNFSLCPLRRQITKSVTRGNFERVRERRRRKEI